jgi:hypothetical protein
LNSFGHMLMPPLSAGGMANARLRDELELSVAPALRGSKRLKGQSDET